MGQVVQIIGSLLVLSAFIGAQRRWFATSSRLYSTLNLAGSTLLAIEAVVEQQWGFLLLEGVWAVVSLLGLIAALRGRPAATPAH